MPYVVALRFDHALADRVRACWMRAVAGVEVADLPTGVDEPHVSLAVYDDDEAVDPGALAALVEVFASKTPPSPIGFPSLGIFPTEENVLFLAPVVTAALLEMHRRFHGHASTLLPACRPHYRPGRWVPHSTLAMRWPMPLLLEVVESLWSEWPRLEGRLRALALIRAEPIETLAEYPLAANRR